MKFSIRDLLLVTVIVALAVSWCVDHRNQGLAMLNQKKAIETLQNDVLEQKLEAVLGSKRLDRLKKDNERVVEYLQSRGHQAEVGNGGQISFPGDGFNSGSGGFPGGRNSLPADGFRPHGGGFGERASKTSAPAPNLPKP